jgi:hypothetical protein
MLDEKHHLSVCTRKKREWKNAILYIAGSMEVDATKAPPKKSPNKKATKTGR